MTVLEQSNVRGVYIGAGTRPLPVEPYVSEAFHRNYVEGVFRRTWINIGRVEEIPNNGDFLVKRIPSVESGILLVRGRDGVVRAMHNVCPHRGNELVWDERGNCRRAFVCPFHGWAFSTDGELAHLTDADAFPGLDPEAIHLTQLRLETWRGFIFVWIDGEPDQDLESFLGEFGDLFSPYPFERFQLHSRYSIKIQANWMVVADAFQESYHARYLHSDFVPSGEDSKVVDAVLMGQHRRASFSDPINSDTAPKPAAGTVASTMLQVMVSDASEPEPTPGFNRKNLKGVRFDANVIFPNFGVHARRNSFLAFRYWPDGPNHMTFEINTYALAPATYADALAVAYHRLLVLAITAEDLSTLERTQRALASGAIKQLHVGDEEVLVRHNHHMVTEAVARHVARTDVSFVGG